MKIKFLSLFIICAFIAHGQENITLVTNSNNTIGNYAKIPGFPERSANPNAFIVIEMTDNLRQVNPHPMGVWFNHIENNWYVYNQDRAAMPIGISIDFKNFTASNQNEIFRSISTINSKTLKFGKLSLSDDKINNRGDLKFYVTSVYNPTKDANGVYNLGEPEAVYNATNGSWIIQNKNGTPLANGSGLQIIALQQSTNNPGANKIINNANKLIKDRKTMCRVTINGFTVNNPTNDHVLEVDGKGDEVFLMGQSFLINPQTGESINAISTTRSPIIGDINNDEWRSGIRIKGGSKLGNLGGFERQDNFPENAPWQRKSIPGKRSVPLIIAEGELMENGQQMMVIPSIWEFDGTTEFQQGLNGFASALGTITVTAAATAAAVAIFGPIGINFVVAAAILGNGLSIQPKNNMEQLNTLPIFAPLQFNSKELNIIIGKTFFGDAKDRPIGMFDNGSDYRYSPIAMLLNYANAVSISNTDFGYGKGVIPIRYKDAPAMGGDYTVYVQIETGNPIANETFNKQLSIDIAQGNRNFSVTNIDNGNSLSQQAGFAIAINRPATTTNIWNVTKKPNTQNSFTISTAAGSYLGVGETGDGTQVTLSQTQSGQMQTWTIQPTGDGSFMIINQYSLKALEINKSSGFVQQSLYNGTKNQHWFINSSN